MLSFACGHAGEGTGLQPLSREEIVRGMQGARHRVVRACPVDPGLTPAIVTVRVSVAASGRISEVRVFGPVGDTPAGSCVERELKLVVFRANQGTAFDYSLRLE